MPYSTFSQPIDVSFEVLWNFLIDKLAHPAYYIEDVIDYEIIERSSKRLLRRLKTPHYQVKEMVDINFKTKEITTTLLEHPKYSGTIVQRVLEQLNPHKQKEVVLAMTIDWKDHQGREDPMDPKFDAMIKDAVFRVKKVLESDESGCR